MKSSVLALLSVLNENVHYYCIFHHDYMILVDACNHHGFMILRLFAPSFGYFSFIFHSFFKSKSLNFRIHMFWYHFYFRFSSWSLHLCHFGSCAAVYSFNNLTESGHNIINKRRKKKTNNNNVKTGSQQQHHAEIFCTRDANCLFDLLNFNFRLLCTIKWNQRNLSIGSDAVRLPALRHEIV